MIKRLAVFIFLILLISIPTSNGFSQTADAYSDFQVSRIAWGVVADLYLGGRNNTTSLSVLRDIVADYWQDNITHATNNNYARLVSRYEKERDQHLALLDSNISQAQATEEAYAKTAFNVIHQVIMEGADHVDAASPPGPDPVVQNFANYVHTDQTTQNIQHTLNGQLVNRMPESAALINASATVSYDFEAGLPPASIPSLATDNQAASPTETPIIIVQPAEAADSSSSANAGDAGLPPNIYKPVRFTNSGLDPVTVRPDTYTPNPEVAPTGRSNASTVVFPGSNPSAYLSLPQGAYTFCYDWELDGDEDGDGYIDYAHKSTGQISLGKNSPEDVDFATTVNLSPETNSNPNGRCNENQEVVTDGLTPQEQANQGTHHYTSVCNWSDGDQTSEEPNITWEFVEGGVIGTSDSDEPEYLSKLTPNVYEQQGEDIYSKITFTDNGFEMYSEGYGYTINCTVTK